VEQIQQLRLMRAAGVCALAPYHESFPYFCPSPGPAPPAKEEEEAFEKYLQSVRDKGIVPNSMMVS
jgi:hypothetical protein